MSVLFYPFNFQANHCSYQPHNFFFQKWNLILLGIYTQTLVYSCTLTLFLASCLPVSDFWAIIEFVVGKETCALWSFASLFIHVLITLE
jgi:hypothetical protein